MGYNDFRNVSPPDESAPTGPYRQSKIPPQQQEPIKFRVTGSPYPWEVYGKISEQAQNALKDGWLSRADIRQIILDLPSYDEEKFNKNSKQYDQIYLFWWLKGYDPGKYGEVASKPYHNDAKSFNHLVRYVDLPAAESGYHNLYTQFLYYHDIFDESLSEEDTVKKLRNVLGAINNANIIAPDDKMELRGLMCLYALAEGKQYELGHIVDDGTSGGTTSVGPLTDAEIDEYRGLRSRIRHGAESYHTLIDLSGSILAAAGVSAY